LSHTPGPWVVSDGEFTDGFVEAVNNGPNTIAGIMPVPERSANARLIAAAPELLEACKEARNCLASALQAMEDEGLGVYAADNLAMKALDAAIAKAEGR